MPDEPRHKTDLEKSIEYLEFVLIGIRLVVLSLALLGIGKLIEIITGFCGGAF